MACLVGDRRIAAAREQGEQRAAAIATPPRRGSSRCSTCPSSDRAIWRRRQHRAQPTRVIKLPPIQRESPLRERHFSLRRARDDRRCRRREPASSPKGQSRRHRRPQRLGQDDAARAAPALLRPATAAASLIDGVDVRDATLRRLRRQIGIVTQDAVIFPGTIAENIAYGIPRRSCSDATARRDRRRRRSARSRTISSCEKPQGYDTPLDGLGGQLSGGQKTAPQHRPRDPPQAPILILDEATSQVDAESEHLIQQAIEALMHERTTFVIAHRFSTILVRRHDRGDGPRPDRRPGQARRAAADVRDVSAALRTPTLRGEGVVKFLKFSSPTRNIRH